MAIPLFTAGASRKRVRSFGGGGGGAGSFNAVVYTPAGLAANAILPTQVGDLIFAYSSTMNTIISPPDGTWTEIIATTAFSVPDDYYLQVYAKKATAVNTSLGTWGGQQPSQVNIYSGFNTWGAVAFNYNIFGNGSWPALTLQVTNNTSWVTAVMNGGQFPVSTGAISPAGYTVRGPGYPNSFPSYDSNSGVSSFPGGSWNPSQGDFAVAIELKV